MAVSMGHKELAEMAHALSRLFRCSIQGGGSELVSLKDELNALEDYIHIQRVRFGERIRYINSIPERFLSAQVMKLTIQPIIENAFIHGLQSRDGEGIVSIDAGQDGDDLRIFVEDTGEGMNPEKIATLNRILSEDPNPDNLWRYGGIENVNLRMKIVYGKRYGISVEAADTNGTRIVLTIPFRDINHV
jgi:two-component system sensor histidine kinase YesM